MCYTKTDLPYGAVGPMSRVMKVITAVAIISFASVAGNKSQSISSSALIVIASGILFAGFL